MRKHYWYIIFSLLFSLFIYVFYRTDKTLINQIIIQFVSVTEYEDLKTIIRSSLPLNKHIIYSLPEGLWVFSITLTSKEFYLMLFNKRIHCVYIPLMYAIGLEFSQLFQFTNGRFDFFDIGISFICWLIAAKINTNQQPQNIFTMPNYNSAVCMLSYCIVYLAHVTSA